MEIKEILRGIMTTALKMSTEEVAELLEKTDGQEILNAILDKDKVRVAELGKTKYQDGYKKAKGESLTEFEKSVKEKYGVADENLQGIELVESIVAKHIEDAKKASGKTGKGAEATEDEIKKHPMYVALENKLKTDLEATENNWKQKLSEQEKAFKKDKSFTSVKEIAQNILSSGKYLLPEDANIATNQKGLFLNSLANGYEYEQVDNTTLVLQNGKRLEDEHGHSVTLDDFLNKQASMYFPIKASNGGGNAGNGNNGGANGSGGAGGLNLMPKTFDELNKIVNDPSIKLEDRETALKNYEAQQAQ